MQEPGSTAPASDDSSPETGTDAMPYEAPRGVEVDTGRGPATTASGFAYEPAP